MRNEDVDQRDHHGCLRIEQGNGPLDHAQPFQGVGSSRRSGPRMMSQAKERHDHPRQQRKDRKDDQERFHPGRTSATRHRP